MSDISDQIEENAAGPKKVRGDSGEVEQHSLKDQIAADKHLANVVASTPKRGGPLLVYRAAPGSTL